MPPPIPPVPPPPRSDASSAVPEGGSGGPTDDDALLRRSAEGDRGAFEALYARYARPIMAFLHHTLPDVATAEDLCQETFVRAWRAAPRFRPGAPVAPWLFRIARNALASELRRRRGPRGLRALLGLRGAVARVSGVSTLAASASPTSRDGLAARLEVAVAALPEAARTAFVLVRLQGVSLDEAARLLDVPVGTVKSRCAAAEAALRRRLRALRPDGRPDGPSDGTRGGAS